MVDLGDDVQVTLKRRALISVSAIALALSACGGGGESDADREAVVQMIERLGQSRQVAECMAEEWDGEYVAEDLQPMIDARGDMSTVDFQLIEAFTTAQSNCDS